MLMSYLAGRADVVLKSVLDSHVSIIQAPQRVSLSAVKVLHHVSRCTAIVFGAGEGSRWRRLRRLP